MRLQSRNYIRRRGVILSDRGLKKLNQAKSETPIGQYFKRYTLEAISEKTGLTANTLSKVFSGSAGVDKQTLQCCFSAFNLTLEPEDYLYLQPATESFSSIESIQNGSVSIVLPISETNGIVEQKQMEVVSDRIQIPQPAQIVPLQNSHPPQMLPLPGGQMPLDSCFYINRSFLESFCYQAIEQPGALLTIRAPKQMGKTSLITRILAYARYWGDRTVSLSLQLADMEIFQNLESFLQWFCSRVGKQLGLPNAIANLWDNQLGSKSNATDYFENFLFPNIDRSLIIVIDELSQLFAYPNIASEFLALLRTWSEQAKESIADRNPWHKIRLVTVHSSEIPLPISINQSLLNAGLTIELPEFTSHQVKDLAERYGQEITDQQIENLIALLGGHPYRLQLAFSYLYRQTITLEQMLQDPTIALALYADHLQQHWWNLQNHPDLLSSFAQIVRQPNPVDCDVRQGSQLYNMGLVHRQGLQVSPACELLRMFFSDRLKDRV